MPAIRVLVRAVAASLAFLLYVWFAAVHNVGEVKRRKRARRERRRASE